MTTKEMNIREVSNELLDIAKKEGPKIELSKAMLKDLISWIQLCKPYNPPTALEIAAHVIEKSVPALKNMLTKDGTTKVKIADLDKLEKLIIASRKEMIDPVENAYVLADGEALSAVEADFYDRDFIIKIAAKYGRENAMHAFGIDPIHMQNILAPAGMYRCKADCYDGIRATKAIRDRLKKLIKHGTLDMGEAA